MKRSIFLPCLVTAFVALSPAATAFANPNPSGTGQPNQDAETQTSEPAGFTTGGFATADQHYANPDATGGTHSGNPKVVSQYDVAAYQISHNGASK
jgi:hypothetical protein